MGQVWSRVTKFLTFFGTNDCVSSSFHLILINCLCCHETRTETPRYPRYCYGKYEKGRSKLALDRSRSRVQDVCRIGVVALYSSFAARIVQSVRPVSETLAGYGEERHNVCSQLFPALSGWCYLRRFGACIKYYHLTAKVDAHCQIRN